MGSKFNVAFNILFYIGDMEKCIDLLVQTDKIPQAAMMSRAYCPSKIDFVTKIWKEKLQTISPSAASALGTPQTHPDCFPTVGDYVVNQVDDVDDEKETNDIVDNDREIEQEQEQQQQYAQESVYETELTEELPSQQSQEQIASEIQTEEATDTNDIDLSDEVSLPSGMEDNESDILNGDDDDDDDFNIDDLDDEL